MEQRQTAPAQDTERAVVDLETFERVWRRVMPNQDMSPIQVGAPTGPGTGVERQAERIPAPAQLQNQDQGAAPAAQIQSSAQLQPQSQVPAPAEQAAGQVRQLDELMEGAWMGHRIYLELARRARGSGARTLNALAAEQRRTAQRLAACWFLLTGACYHFSSPPIPRVCPLAAALPKAAAEAAVHAPEAPLLLLREEFQGRQHVAEHLRIAARCGTPARPGPGAAGHRGRRG